MRHPILVLLLISLLESRSVYTLCKITRGTHTQQPQIEWLETESQIEGGSGVRRETNVPASTEEAVTNVEGEIPQTPTPHSPDYSGEILPPNRETPGPGSLPETVTEVEGETSGTPRPSSPHSSGEILPPIQETPGPADDTTYIYETTGEPHKTSWLELLWDYLKMLGLIVQAWQTE
ncbi:hypothetical protein SprV_0802599700 [Sparganum proliferum]